MQPQDNQTPMTPAEWREYQAYLKVHPQVAEEVVETETKEEQEKGESPIVKLTNLFGVGTEKEEDAKETKETKAPTVDEIEAAKAGGILEGKEAEQEGIQMGKTNLNWITKTKHTTKIKWHGSIGKTYEFQHGNYASIYRGNTFVRFAPFIAKSDLESDQNWAQFYYNDFYNKKPSPLPWERIKLRIIWMPLDKSEPWCENIGGGGIHIKVDEHGRCQVPLKVALTDEERQKMLKNNRMVGQALLLKSTLTGYEKPKANWWLWAIIAIVILIVVMIAMLYIINPHLFSGITATFNKFLSGLAPPGQAKAPG